MKKNILNSLWFYGLFALVLGGIKLFMFPAWPWWAVMSPVWATLVFTPIAFVLCFLVVLPYAIASQRREADLIWDRISTPQQVEARRVHS